MASASLAGERAAVKARASSNEEEEAAAALFVDALLIVDGMGVGCWLEDKGESW